MPSRSKTPQAEPEIHAPDARDQEPGIDARLNRAGLITDAQSLKPARM